MIDTAGLRLRPHRDSDLPAMIAMWSDPAVVRHIGGRLFTAAETAARLARYRALWPTHGHGYWAIEDRATGRFIGEAGFARFGRGLGPAFDDAPEAGWVLAAPAQGRGLGTEAVAALHDWADTALALPRTVCMITPDNGPSLRLAAMFGYARFDDVMRDGAAVWLMARPRGAARSGQPQI
ncbi:GNAT family N-acetyltransferase [Roseicyclus marinus]|uniref:GNAT family N-acetyltransferase n=1 Tax=Roseicyclus marinus TaxID=2161673 RepID=UPI00240F9D9D|nr:GNAT family N-acetyltransferase [Roseicyclus marinus]MDG3041911.1 GNAT family N-acetyltransferase [Roseicyclus marinus]